MNPVVCKLESIKKVPRGWIYRLLIGSGLLAISAWGIGACRETFQTFLGPTQSPADPGFVNVAAWTAWSLFFGPVAAAGFLTILFTLRKMGALEKIAVLLEKLSGRSDGLQVGNNQFEARGPRNENYDLHGLESLSAEQVEQLKVKATRAAFLLGLVAGVSLLGIGVVGLVCLSSLSQPYSGSAPYVPLGTGRLTINLAVLSGISLLLGLFVLQRTLRKENSAWMLPLRMFTHTVLRREKVSRRARSTPHPPDTKLLS
jgi:hypothetical protein